MRLAQRLSGDKDNSRLACCRLDVGFGEHFLPNTQGLSEGIRSHGVKEGGAACGCSLLPLGDALGARAGAVLLSVVEKRVTNHERRPRHAADGADKSAQGILEVFWHGRYATFLKDTIVCLWVICAAVGSSLQQK